MSALAALYSALPSAPRLITTNPVIPSCFRAFITAPTQPDFIFWPCLCAFFDTTRPFLLRQRSFLVKPPLVYTKGGLTKKDLCLNKNGRVVSKKAHKHGQKMNSGWVGAVM